MCKRFIFSFPNHLPGTLDFVNTVLPGDTRFNAVPNAAQTDATRGVYTYDAQSRIPLKLDAYKQDLMREYIKIYLASKTAAEKAVLTVGDMAAWIVAHLGNELGISAAANAEIGIPAAAELRLAVTRYADGKLRTGKDASGLGIDYNEIGSILKIDSSLTLAQFEGLTDPQVVFPNPPRQLPRSEIEGFYFETREYTLRVLELDVDRVQVIRDNMRIIDLLCAWAGIPNSLRATTGKWWNV